MFWDTYRARFGAESNRPESYWAPWMAATFGLLPDDLGNLTAHQMNSCVDWMEDK